MYSLFILRRMRPLHYLWQSVKKGLGPRDGYRHYAKKGSSKLLEKFLAGGALVGGAVATGELISAARGGRDPEKVDSQVYIKDSSSNLLKLSGVEGGGLNTGTILGIAIFAVLGFMVCIPVVRCMRRIWNCGKKKEKETFMLPTGSFHYKESLPYPVQHGLQTTQASGWTPTDAPDVHQAPPVFPTHQVKSPHSHFPSPVAWDQEDVSEDPIVTGVCTGFYNQETLPDPPAQLENMEDVMATLEERVIETLDTEEEDDFKNLGKRNNLGERLRGIKKRAMERVSRD